MNGTAIKVENLSKRYRIGGTRAPYKTIRESLTNAITCLFQRSNSQSDIIWALKDVSFEVKHGEVVGIIGRNGAGKTTLLKILSQITEPTEGYAELHGRVGSLLEVGTGFHPELTGRENIFLNAAILGMKKREINCKFDEIVAFAEVEKFVDTPMKHYSSGMQVRLAFAIAAHLEPEILLVDEVLAVGDAAFQKKCLGKMGDVAKEGRTVLFVSHNMAAVELLTKNCLLLEYGNLVLYADTKVTVTNYLKQFTEQRDVSAKDWKERSGAGGARLIKFLTLAVDGTHKQIFRPGEAVKLLIGVEFHKPLIADIGVVIETSMEKALFTSHLSDNCTLKERSDYHEFIVTLSPNYLRHGKYLTSIAVFAEGIKQLYDVIFHFPAFDIDGSSDSQYFPLDGRWGELYFNLSWETAEKQAIKS